MNRRNFILGGLSALGAAAAGGAWFVNRPEFGQAPSGERLKRILSSPHYKNGKFENLVPVEVMTKGGENRIVATWKFLFGDKSELMPKTPMISKKTKISSLARNEDVIIWLGHSTFYLQTGGHRILIDPVFSGYASPLFFINRAFDGSNICSADDFPEIDLLAVTHDHWDHLDYPTIMSLAPKIKNIVCPLGVGEYFEQWGFPKKILREEDWYTEIKLSDDFIVHVLPSQHFSGRLLRQNPTLWCGYSFITPRRKIYCSGDGGYGSHFADIGKKFGGFDVALLENGQYNLAWHSIHMLPSETAQAGDDVGAKFVIPSHGGKFALARHPWQEPYRELTRESEGRSYRLITPVIGEAVHLDKLPEQKFSKWWEQME